MLTKQQIQEIKGKNLSQDKEKTAERIPNGFKSADKNQKKEILDLLGFSNGAIYNVSKTGSASAKTVLALAQILNVSPYYYIGAVDEQEACTDELFEKFIEEFNLGPITKAKAKRGRKGAAPAEPEEKPKSAKSSAKKEKPQAVPESEPESVVAPVAEDTSAAALDELDIFEICLEADGSDMMKTAVDELTLEDASILLSALYKKANANENAADLLEIVKYCLLS